MPGPTGNRVLRQLLLAVTVSAGLAGAADAQPRPDAKKLAAAELSASQAAEAAHDHRGAYDHALGAWQLDQGSPALLLRAAEQAVLAGLDDQAEPLFRQWLGLANRDLSHDLRARGQLAEIVHRRANSRAEQAAAASKAGDHSAARRLFLEAAALDPGEPELLFGAAQEALAVHDDVAAARLLGDYLKVAPVDAPNRPKASQQLSALGHPVATTTEPTAAPTDNTWTVKQKWGVGLAGGGLALALAGGGLLWAWSATGDELTRFQTSTVAVGQEKTLAQQQEIENRQRNYLVSGSAACALGAAALGAGAWLLLSREPGAVAVVPTGSEGRLGLLVAVRL